MNQSLSSRVTRRRRAAWLASITLAGVVGYGVHAVRAQGIPTTHPLWYRGTLEEGGVRVNAPRMITVKLWSGADRMATMYCADTASVVVTDGAFEVPLDSCVPYVRANSDPWVEVSVGTATIGARIKLGAVPYAIIADRASNAEPMSALAMQITAIQSQNTALMTQVATLQAQVAGLTAVDRDCPNGYTRDTSDSSITGDQRLCVRGSDQVVRVGVGNGAFWIDRYEASVWANADGSGAQYGATDDNYPPGFPDNGQWSTAVYALSKPDVRPSVNLTWFQANEACRMGGKQLATGDEWLTAARGTPDNETNCHLATSSTVSRATHSGTGCRSRWGAEDMIGNVWEWTCEWYAGIGNGTRTGYTSASANDQPWPPGYGGDVTSNINTYVDRGNSQSVPGMPAASIRGGSWNTGSFGGVYAISLSGGPTRWDTTFGFRCVVRP